MMLMAMRANRKHLPWLIAILAAALTVGVGVLLS